MSKPRTVKLAKPVQDALDACGVEWEVVDGKKHWHIRVGGRLVGVAPKGGNGRERGGATRSVLNTASQIRRAAKELVGG